MVLVNVATEVTLFASVPESEQKKWQHWQQRQFKNSASFIVKERSLQAATVHITCGNAKKKNS